MAASNEDELLAASPADLLPMTRKILSRNRLSVSDGLTLFETPHLSFLQQLADFRRCQYVGQTVFYASTLHIYPTNLCELSCPICSFFAKPGQDKAWFLSPSAIEEKVRAALPLGISEIHIVGGLWKACSLEYYHDVLQRIRTLDPLIHIKALTPVEYDFLARLHHLSITEVLQKMISWGLGSLPGGGAEILNDDLRKKIVPGKINSQRYLEIHQTAHMLGLPSNVTMLFGHLEEPHHIISHLDKLRRLQDLTKGIHTFVPLKFQCENNALGRYTSKLIPKDCKRIYALSRLMLDNIRNIKILWNYMGLETACELLSWGGNDLGSVTCGEQVATMAGGISMTVTDTLLEQTIRAVDRIPMKVHSGQTFSSSPQPPKTLEGV